MRKASMMENDTYEISGDLLRILNADIRELEKLTKKLDNTITTFYDHVENEK